MGWVKYSTVGAKAGTDLKDSAGNVLADSAVKNSSVTISSAGALSGAGGGTVAIGSLSGSSAYQNSQISISAAGALSGAGGGTVAIGSLSGSSGYNNQSITVNTTTGILENIGTGSIKVNNAKQDWQDVSGTGIPADGATVGAVFGTNLYKSGTTNFTAAEIKNANQDYSDVVGTKPPSDATKGAVFGTNLYSTGTTNFTAAELKNSSITLNAAGYLNNIGTTEKVKNALVEINSDGSLNYAGEGSGSVSKAGLNLDYTDGATVGATFGTNLYKSGTTNFTAAEIKNANQDYSDVIGTKPPAGATVGATFGTNLYKSGTTNFTAAEIKNANQDYSDVIGTKPPAGATVGATWNGNVGSQPADNDITNSRIKMTIDGTLDYNNANEAAPSLANIAGIVGKTQGGFGESLAGKTGAPYFSSAGNFSFGTIPAANGGTGLTAVTTLLNSSITVNASTGKLENIGTADIVVNNQELEDDLLFGPITVTEGSQTASFSTLNGTSYTANNTTGNLRIIHPTAGAFDCTYTWSRTDATVSAFALTDTGSGNDAWTSSTFGTAGIYKAITITHTASSTTLVLVCIIILLDGGGGGGGK